MIPFLSIVILSFELIFAVAFPVVICVVGKKKFGASVKHFFIGFAVFILFGLALAGVVHVFVAKSALWNSIVKTTWLHALYKGCIEGVFETAGCYIAFKTVLKKQLDDIRMPVMYGAGHASCSIFFGMTLGYAFLLFVAILTNAGGLDGITMYPLDLFVSGMSVKMMTLSPYIFFTLIFEQIFEVVIQICLSIIICYGVKNFNPFWFPLALFLKTGTATAITLLVPVMNRWWLDFVYLCITATIAMFTYGVYCFEKESPLVSVKEDTEGGETV